MIYLHKCKRLALGPSGTNYESPHRESQPYNNNKMALLTKRTHKFKPYDLIFAKMKGHHCWPGRVEPFQQNPSGEPPKKYPTIFYGTGETGNIKALCEIEADNKIDLNEDQSIKMKRDGRNLSCLQENNLSNEEEASLNSPGVVLDSFNSD